MEDENKVEAETLESQDEGETSENNSPDESLNLEELKKKAELADNYKIRAEKAEAKLKQKEVVPKSDTPSISKEELILIAKGYDEKAIDLLNVIAKGSGVSIKEAQDSELFKSYLDKVALEKKSSKAKLGASNSSGSFQPKAEVTPNMTKEDHKELWNKKMGR